ncbi:hypothetical protein GBA52_022826 [Prunus armeniaca]|nr:hypothetical protein GBA52_022826 [Prunus armeniaca]
MFEQSPSSPADITCFVSSTLVQEPYNEKGITKLYKERSTRTSITYITSDDDSSANELSPANGSYHKKEPCSEKWSSEIKNGPNTFGIASTIQVEAPHSSAPPNYDDSPPTHYKNHEVSVNYNKQHARSLPCFQYSASINVSGNRETRSCRFYPEVGSSGNETDGMEDRHLFPGDGNDFSSGRKNWNRQFEDATTAAQAAADSAQMASITPRAAVELSRQCSSKSRDVSMKKQSSKSEVIFKSDLQAGFGDIRSENKSCMSSFRSESTFCSDDWEGNSRWNEHIAYTPQMADHYSQKKSSEPEKIDLLGELSMKRQSYKPELIYATYDRTDVLRGNDLISYFGLGDGKIHQSTEGMNSYGNAAVIFDDSGSVQMTITVNLMWRRTTRDNNFV